ncbi:MAG: hypothetical protein PUC90_02860 [Prevotella sp.]|nr:hypothetical protein [Prevotella sp.]
MANRGRPKGLPKTGGRKKGVKNKRTRIGGDETLQKLISVMEDPERMAKELAEIHGRDYFRVYTDLLCYVRPKYSSVDWHGEIAVENEAMAAIKDLINEREEETE